MLCRQTIAALSAGPWRIASSKVYYPRGIGSLYATASHAVQLALGWNAKGEQSAQRQLQQVDNIATLRQEIKDQ